MVLNGVSFEDSSPPLPGPHGCSYVENESRPFRSAWLLWTKAGADRESVFVCGTTISGLCTVSYLYGSMAGVVGSWYIAVAARLSVRSSAHHATVRVEEATFDVGKAAGGVTKILPPKWRETGKRNVSEDVLRDTVEVFPRRCVFRLRSTPTHSSVVGSCLVRGDHPVARMNSPSAPASFGVNISGNPRRRGRISASFTDLFNERSLTCFPLGGEFLESLFQHLNNQCANQPP